MVKKKSTRSPKKPKPTLYPEDFGLDVIDSEPDMFRWFLLCFLLAKPIQSGVAINTWRLFIEHGLDTPFDILAASDYELVRTLREGKYTRYQHVMANALHTCMKQLERGYDGSIMMLIENSYDQDEVRKRLQELYGVGPKTSQIFTNALEEYFARKLY